MTAETSNSRRKALLESIEQSFRLLLRNLPKLVIYIICAYQFLNNVIPLIANYVHFQTIVMVQYKIPEEIPFPAFSVCGCCIEQVIRDKDFIVIADNEFQMLQTNPIEKVFGEKSYDWEQFVINCSFIYDTRKGNSESCTILNPVVESIHDGRKCITFFSTISDDVTVKPRRIKDSERYTSYIYLEVDFPNIKKQVIGDYSLQMADTVITFHSPNMLPSMNDMEFFRLDPEAAYEVQFTKDITKLLPWPYSTRCEQYDEYKKPRSRNECVNLCIVRESYQSYNCVNYFGVMSRGILEYAKANIAEDLQYCSSRGYQSYLEYIEARDGCMDECSSDCLVENYKVNIDSSPTDSDTSKSTLVIRPNREISQEVQHEGELSLVELIGCLGGHAHIWLGLSAIQFYDVLVKVIRKLINKFKCFKK